ncbi:hypothetical protein L195_g021444 [Trifolium pratense]|uniref:Uncharacterized protein n=1 Tax=Trifolium pratense TaxID=57577 RepID=A0A2K3N596_TRIPR|nr:hypothetical protein L195_g021444 [Trifolium pratense]
MAPGKGKGPFIPAGMLSPARVAKGSAWSENETGAMVRGVGKYRDTSATQAELFENIELDWILGTILAGRSSKAISTKYGKGVQTGIYLSLNYAGPLRKRRGHHGGGTANPGPSRQRGGGGIQIKQLNINKMELLMTLKTVHKKFCIRKSSFSFPVK